MHHVTAGVPDAAFGGLKRNAAAGTDGVTWHDYPCNPESNPTDLRARLHCVDADIARFFDTVSHEWLLRFVELRIGDPRVLRLLRKWLKA